MITQHDGIYGEIVITCPLAIFIINTDQFQRLRRINQLGGKYYKFERAWYSRYKHSLGVYHLARMVMRTLRKNQPELAITNNDVLCVEIAGLCHDLGHGPLSHTFEEFLSHFVPTKKWTHEQASIDIFEFIYVRNIDAFESNGFSREDVNFVKSLIRGEPVEEESTGRTEAKSFMYDIISNKRNGIDVDRWDGLARDHFYLGLNSEINCKEWIEGLRVISVDGSAQLCARDDTANTIFKLCSARYNIYTEVYHDVEVRAIELMIVRALIKAAPHLYVRGHTILECLNNIEAYTHLDDDIIRQILDSEEIQLLPSKRLISKVKDKQLWDLVIEREVHSYEGDVRNTQLKTESEASLVHDICTRNYGKGSANPLGFIRFYNPSRPNETCETPKIKNLPGVFQRKFKRTYRVINDV